MAQPKTLAVGIDLGTTYSAVARIDESGRTTMVRTEQGELLTPSVVLFDDREIVVGRDAKKMLGIQTDRVADCVKRDMGSRAYTRLIRGAQIPPEVIQSCILRKLKTDAAKVLGGEPRVVITVPAYFDERRRTATLDAAEMAGLDVLDIVNEPTAAALAYGEQLGFLDPVGAPQGNRNILVYDLGGGTFDVTVLNLQAGAINTLATDGDARLGGRDWDERLAEFLAEEFTRQQGFDPRIQAPNQARLLAHAEQTKHTLSGRDQAAVHLEFNGRTQDVVVTRAKFEELTEDLLERTAYTARQVLQQAKLDWKQIQHILLVGGSTRMPMVPVMLERVAGLKAEHTINPDEAVARGAAIFAGHLMALEDKFGPDPKFRVRDVNAHSLGIEGINSVTQRKENVILIPRNTPLPARASEKFITKSASQKSVVLQVLEGESRMPAQCIFVAKAVIRNLPEGLPQGWPIEVTYEYGRNGRLSVQAVVPGTSQAVRMDLERDSTLSSDHMNRWRKLITSKADGPEADGSFESILESLLSSIDPADLKSQQPTAPVARPAPAAAAGAPIASPQPLHPQPLASSSGGQAPQAGSRPQAIPNTMPNPAQPAANVPRGVPVPRGTPLQPSGGSSSGGGAKGGGDDFEIDWQAGTGPAGSGLAGTSAATWESSPSGFANTTTTTVSTRKRSSLAPFFYLIAHISAAVVGLSLGYYILCWINPASNFLDLALPGLEAPAESGTDAGS